MQPNRLIILFTAIFLLLLIVTGQTQPYSGAQLYSGGSYGSIGYGSTGSNSTQSGIVLDFNPIFVAQNTATGSILPTGSTPAPITVIPSPNPTPNPTLSAGSPLFQLPFDPYAVSNPTPVSIGSPIFNPGASSGSRPVSNSGGIYSGNYERFFPETYEAVRRFRDATRVDFTYLPGGKKDKSFGMTEFDIRMQLGIPCRFIPTHGSEQGFFYVAPGAKLTWWDGPNGPPDMSPNGFGAFLDFGMQPQFNDVFSLNAWFRFGVFSDFKKVSSKSLRYQGGIEGTFNVDPHIQIIAGFIYLDRVRHKILPTGGVIWTPQDDLVLKLVFPNPKISKRLWNNGNSEWWGYIQGDYGGGTWSIKDIGKTDYNDIRIGAGLEFETPSRIGGYFEFGGSVARELYSNGQRWAKPPSVLYLKTGFIF